MKHTRSSDEADIRAAVVDRLRHLLPGVRIVHELNVAGQGSNRIDVAGVTKDLIIGVEIKSKKDTLKRLDEQWTAFNRACHHVVVAAHEKHFREHIPERQRADVPADRYLDHPLFFNKWSRRRQVWIYPQPPNEDYDRAWRLTDQWSRGYEQPRATDMLEMLWADELRKEALRHRIPATSRTTRPHIIRDMVWLMTGKEICHAVCRQLRARSFAEADPPIYETISAGSAAPQAHQEAHVEP